MSATRAGPPRRPLTGGYYWIPLPGGPATAWNILTCHDLGLGSGISHRALWPSVVATLAELWQRDAQPLVRCLRDHYAGLPRGRVTRSQRGYLLLHGNDAPAADWLDRSLDTFHLPRARTRVLFDEHETMIRDDVRAVENALAIDFHA